MSLRSFLKKMGKRGEIVHVREEVSPRFEVSSITKAFDGAPVLFFDKVKTPKRILRRILQDS